MQDYKMLYEKMEPDVRKALYQWIIDHSTISQKTGTFAINFHITGEDDMWRRVYYRYTGQYERYLKEEQVAKKQMTTYNWMKNNADMWQVKFKKIDDGKNYYLKFVVWLHRKTKNIIKNTK